MPQALPRRRPRLARADQRPLRQDSAPESSGWKFDISFQRGTLPRCRQRSISDRESASADEEARMTNDAPDPQNATSPDFVSRIETELLRTRKVLILGDITDP